MTTNRPLLGPTRDEQHQQDMEEYWGEDYPRPPLTYLDLTMSYRDQNHIELRSDSLQIVEVFDISKTRGELWARVVALAMDYWENPVVVAHRLTLGKNNPRSILNPKGD